MDEGRRSPVSTLAYATIAIGVCLAATLSPILPIPLTNDIGVPWDSLPRLLAIVVLGTLEGILAGVGASFTTWTQGGSWIVVVLPVVETIFVLLLMKSRRAGPLLAECLFWAIAGPILAGALGAGFGLKSVVPLATTCLGSLLGAVIAEACRWMIPNVRTGDHHSKPPIREVMATPMVAAALIVSLAAVVVHDRLVRRDIEKRVLEETRKITVSTSSSVTEWLSRRIDALAPAVRGATTNDLKPSRALVSVLEGLVAALPEIRAITVTNSKGMAVVAHPPRDALGARIVGRRIFEAGYWLEIVSRRGPSISEPRFSASTLSPSIEVVVPVRSGSGDILGAVVASLELSPLRFLLERSARATHDDIALTITDSALVVVASTKSGLRPMSMFRRSLDENTFSFSAPIENAPWMLVAEGSLDVAIGNVSKSTSTVLVFLAPSALLAFLLASAASALMSRSLSSLAKITENLPDAITLGRERMEWPSPLSREASLLVSNFQAAAVTLRDLWMKLESMKDTLEIQVKARTRELEEANRELERLATTDRLTGLWNRARFDEFLAKEVKRCQRYGRPLSLLMIDLDHFKRVNDTHGHRKGDEVLAAVGELLLDSSRNSDLPARYGGEEMALVLPETPLDGAVLVAERLRKAVSSLEFHDADGKMFNVTCSIGVAGFDSKIHHQAKDLVEAADVALYRAKNNGRDRVECQRPSREKNNLSVIATNE